MLWEQTWHSAIAPRPVICTLYLGVSSGGHMVCIGALFAGLYQSLPMPGVVRLRGVVRHPGGFLDKSQVGVMAFPTWMGVLR